MKVLCSEGCNVCSHYPACWHAFERAHKVDHPEFSFKACTLIMPVIPMQGLLNMFANEEVTCSDTLRRKSCYWTNKHVGAFLAGCICAMLGDAATFSLQQECGKANKSRHLGCLGWCLHRVNEAVWGVWAAEQGDPGVPDA